MKVFITEASAFEGEAMHYTNENGYPAGYPLPCVVARDVTGKQWLLPNSFWTEHDEDGFGPYPRSTYDLAKAKEIAQAAEARGYIQAEHWVEAYEPERDILSYEEEK